MQNEFSRTELLIGAQALNRLKTCHVAVFGLGGVGSYVVEALTRCAIGKFDLIDNDKISQSNINRQIFALQSTLGQYKTDVAKKRILDINKNAIVNTHNLFFMPDNSNQLNFSNYDYIIDAIDTITAKIELVQIANKLNIPIISSMGTGNKLNPLGFIVDDIYKTSVCPLAKVMRKELKQRGIKKLKVVYSKEIPITPKEEIFENNKKIPASIAFLPSVAGLIIASEVVKDLIE